MHKFVLAIFLMFGAAFSSEVRASEDDGNSLLADCNSAIRALDNRVTPSRAEALGIGRCFGLIQGIKDLNTLYRVKDEGSAFFCPPDEVTLGQAARIIIKYMRDNPNKLHMPDSILIIAALEDAYPCTDER